MFNIFIIKIYNGINVVIIYIYKYYIYNIFMSIIYFYDKNAKHLEITNINRSGEIW